MADVITYRDSMKSEYSERGAYQNLSYKPVFRASSLFYALVTPNTDTLISFLNYWSLKNNLASVSALLTLRDEQGEKIFRNYFQLKETVYQFSVADLVKKTDFNGSIEIELFSAEDLKYAYPAVDVFLRTPAGVSFVHTSQRVFNDLEDMDRGASLNPRQSCFDIHLDSEYAAFITMINGPRVIPDSSVKLQVFNSAGAAKNFEISLGNLPAYGARFIRLDETPGLAEFVGSGAGFCKVDFKNYGVFNRVMCGNRKRDNSFLTVTHSFYDCAHHEDYFLESEVPENEYAAFFPFSLIKGLETELIFYPIYCKAELFFSLSCFSSEGALTKRIKDFAVMDTVGTQMQRMNIREIIRVGGGEPSDGFYALEVHSEDGRIPMRLNFGLNYKKNSMGCNISTSVWMNQAFAKRRRSFAWGPLWVDGSGRNCISILNMGQSRSSTAKAEAVFSVFSKKGEIYKKPISLSYASSLDLILEDLIPSGLLPEQPEVWWFSIQSSAPTITCNQLHISRQGYVGADHSF